MSYEKHRQDMPLVFVPARPDGVESALKEFRRRVNLDRRSTKREKGRQAFHKQRGRGERE